MMAAKGAVNPVYEVMETGGETFDPSVYLPTVTGYYTDPEGNMLSMPYNSSTPVLYYNKDAFEQAGLDTNAPPKTWGEFGEVLDARKAPGSSRSEERRDGKEVVHYCRYRWSPTH